MATVSTPVVNVTPDNDVVALEIFIAASRERIFEALTDPQQAGRWWGQGAKYHFSNFEMDLRVGGKWACSGVSETMGRNISVKGEFLEIDPPRRLSYSWSSSWMPAVTTVVWELESQPGGTLVKLTHSGFAGDAEQAKNHGIGWTNVLGWLQAFLERGETVARRS